MSMGDDEADRLFPPTPRRREEARRSGRVAHSRLLASALVLLVMMAALRWGGEWLWNGIRATAERPWSGGAWTRVADVQPQHRARELLMSVGVIVAPWLSLVVAIAVLANIGQFGFLFRPERLAERWENPLGTGAGGTGRRLRDALFGMAQVGVVVGVAFWRLEPLFRGELPLEEPLSGQSGTVLSPAAAIAAAILETGVYASGLLVAVGLIDYGWNWWRLERSLWMTTEELREELRGESARRRPPRKAA
jgi:flagellar biosynthetic protein FlhB